MHMQNKKDKVMHFMFTHINDFYMKTEKEVSSYFDDLSKLLNVPKHTIFFESVDREEKLFNLHILDMVFHFHTVADDGQIEIRLSHK